MPNYAYSYTFSWIIILNIIDKEFPLDVEALEAGKEINSKLL